MRQKTANQTKPAGLLLVNGQMSRRSWLGLACLLLLTLIIWMWFAQQSLFGMLGYVPSSSRRALDSTTENFAASGNGTTQATPDTTASVAAGGGSNGQSSTNTSTTTNTRVIERTSTGSPAPTPAPSSPTASPAQPAQENMPLLYASIDGGQNKQQLISLAGSNPDKCTQLTLDSLGQQEICSWAKDNQAVTATLLNNQVTAKTKIGF